MEREREGRMEEKRHQKSYAMLSKDANSIESNPRENAQTRVHRPQPLEGKKQKTNKGRRKREALNNLVASLCLRDTNCPDRRVRKDGSGHVGIVHLNEGVGV